MRDSHTLPARRALLVWGFLFAGCAIAMMACGRSAKSAKKQTEVDPRIATEVVLAQMAFSEIDGNVPPDQLEEVRAAFRSRVSGPLEEAASGKLDRSELLEKLAAAVAGDDSYVSMQAAMMLARLADKKDEEVVEAMIEALGERRQHVRGNAAAVLETVGDEQAVESLVGLLTDPSAAVAANSASALGKIGDARAVEPLILLLGKLQHGACGYRRSYVEHIVPRVPYVWMLSQEQAEGYRRGGMNPDDATAMFSMPLTRMLDSKDRDLCSYVRWHTASALRKITGKRQFGDHFDLWQMWWNTEGRTKKR